MRTISGFTGTSEVAKMRTLGVLALLLAFSSCAVGQVVVQSKENNGAYSVEIVKDGRAQDVINRLPRAPSIARLNDRLYRVTLSLGSPNSYTYFVDPLTEKVDGPLFLFQKLNERNLKVVFVGSDGRLSSKTLFQDSTVVSYDLPDAAPVAVISNAIVEVLFLPDDSIRIRYYAGADFQEKEVVLP